MGKGRSRKRAFVASRVCIHLPNRRNQAEPWLNRNCQACVGKSPFFARSNAGNQPIDVIGRAMVRRRRLMYQVFVRERTRYINKVYSSKLLVLVLVGNASQDWTTVRERTSYSTRTVLVLVR